LRIALDAMGGDLAPKAAVEGAVLAARDFGLEVVLVGLKDIIESELAAHDTAGLAIRVAHAPEVVAMDDSPLESVLTKPLSSIHLAMEMVKRGDVNGFVSAGNSGAVMAAAMAILGNLAHVDRPAIASLIPATGSFSLLIDAGANTEVKATHLAQFAVMGSVYSHRVRNIARPRVGILSNGEEASKGTDVTRGAAEMLSHMAAHVNYIGYVEGRDINRGKADVVVTDGFTGNVALKTMEGFAAFLLGHLREMFTASWRGRLAYLMIRKALSAMRQDLDPHEYGGAPLLGVNGIAIIAHGSSNAHAIRNAIRAASNEALVHQVNAEIVDILAKSESALGAKPAGKGIRGMFAKMRDRLSRTREAEERERRINAASSTVPVGAVAHDDFLPPEERIKREAVETARKESIKESLKKESLKTEATPALEQQTTPLNGAKSTGELHLHNGEKAAEKTVVIETIETNPRKEPRS
jgi:glycerol-3-phosphate acyltransferase PlsX